MDYNPVLRLRFLIVLFVLLALLLIGRLFNIQLVNGEDYKLVAEGQYINQSGNLYNRGTIFFKKRDGVLVSAATLKRGYNLVINPSRLEDPEGVYRILSKYVELEKEDFFFKAAKHEDPHEELVSGVSEEVADKIKEHNLTGVVLESQQKRYYPGDSLASHVLGFVGFSGAEFSGRYGVERYYDETLDRTQEKVFKNFFVEIFSGIGDILKGEDLQKDGDIVLTIEPLVQNFVEKELEELVEEFYISAGGVIVIDPNTGEIASMAAYPSFDPGNYFDENDINIFSNPLVSNIYEFGSILKPLTVAAALDADAITKSDTFNDPGFVVIDGSRINNFDKKGRGNNVPIQEVLNQSLNTGAIYVMQQLGRGKFKEYIENFGLAKKTQIDLPEEINGDIKNLDSKREIEFATASFGQGVAYTPIGITRALSTLANDGILIRPHVVSEFKYTGLPSKEINTEEQGKVLKQSTSRRISTMLTEVVDDALLDGTVALPQYSIAAKTGTAQIPAPDGGYYEDRFLHSFFGYFPSYDPEFLVFLYIVKPVGARYASQTLTEPFMDITEFLLNYYEIPPDRQELAGPAL